MLVKKPISSEGLLTIFLVIAILRHVTMKDSYSMSTIVWVCILMMGVIVCCLSETIGNKFAHWHLKRRIGGRLRPLHIQVCPEDRYPELEALYAANEPHGIPASGLEEYGRSLREGRLLTLIAEEDGHLVATFALVRSGKSPVLCYLFVDPSHHRKGIGVTLILACLALLPKDLQTSGLWVFGVPKTISFYYKLGFKKITDYTYEGFGKFPAVMLPITTQLCTLCGRWLRDAGVVLPHPLNKIPTVSPEAGEASVDSPTGL